MVARRRRNLKYLAENLYRACGKTDLKTSYQSLAGKDCAPEWIMKDVKNVFDVYIKKYAESPETVDLLEEKREAVLEMVPEYVRKRKVQLGYADPPEKSGPKKLINTFTVITAAGVIVPLAAEILWAAGKTGPKCDIYTMIAKASEMIPFTDASLNETYKFCPSFVFAVNETAGLLFGASAGLAVDRISNYVSGKVRKIRRRDPHRPFYRKVKKILKE